MKRPRFDWFLTGMAAAIALAWAFPGPGSDGGWMHPELLTRLGVALIFFLHGLSLAFGALKEGAARWRLHLVVQASTFLVFPLLGLLIDRGLRPWASTDLRLGIFYLCALPSTVSSSVAMTAAARGNVAAAIFNATLSSLLGIFVTPLWVAWMVGDPGGGGGGAHAMPLARVFVDLLLWLVAPLAIGQLLRPWLGPWAGRNKAKVGVVDRLTILLLVYTSFCDSVARGVWTGQGVGALATALGASALILAVMLGGIGWASDRLGFPAEDRSAAAFCGSKKTLASGVPMAHLIFGPSPSLGVILLPIMIYHPLQLVVCGALASRWADRGRGVGSEARPGEPAEGPRR